jgi:hypothetical protein
MGCHSIISAYSEEKENAIDKRFFYTLKTDIAEY